MRQPGLQMNQRVIFKRNAEGYTGPIELVPPQHLGGTSGIIRPFSPDPPQARRFLGYTVYYVRAVDQTYHLVHEDWLEPT